MELLTSEDADSSWTNSPDVRHRLQALSQNFVAQASRDPKAVIFEIWHEFTRNASSERARQILSQLEEVMKVLMLRTSLPSPAFKLELTHACVATGCSDTHCDLCRENPFRKCTQGVSARNLVDAVLAPKCGASLKVHIVPLRPTQHHQLTDFRLQVCVVDGSKRKEDTWAKLPQEALLTYEVKDKEEKKEGKKQGKKQNAGVRRLLCLKEPSQGDMPADNFIYFPASDLAVDALGTLRMGDQVVGGGLRLPDLIQKAPGETALKCKLKTPGEAALKSKLPDEVLAIRAVDKNLQPLDHIIQPVYSNPFQVISKRSKPNMKEDIPLLDTEVSKIEGVGKQMAKKLNELSKHMKGDYEEVEKVEQLCKLIEKVKRNQSEKELFKALNTTQESWDIVVAHAQRAVGIDNRMRVFMCTERVLPSRDVGLIFACNRGEVQFTADGVRGYVVREHGLQRCFRLQRPQQLSDVQDHNLRAVLDAAQHAWRQPSHPGWHIFRLDGAEITDDDKLPGDHCSTTADWDSYDLDCILAAGCLPDTHHEPPPALCADQDYAIPPPLCASGGTHADLPALPESCFGSYSGPGRHASAGVHASDPFDMDMEVSAAPGLHSHPSGDDTAVAAEDPPSSETPLQSEHLGASALESSGSGGLRRFNLSEAKPVSEGWWIPAQQRGLGSRARGFSHMSAQLSPGPSGGLSAEGASSAQTPSSSYTGHARTMMGFSQTSNSSFEANADGLLGAAEPFQTDTSRLSLRAFLGASPWQGFDGSEGARPSSLNDLGSPSDIPRILQAAGCFHTEGERADDEDLHSELQLQASMDLNFDMEVDDC